MENTQENTQEKTEKVFVEGMNCKFPHDAAPKFVLLNMGFNAHKFFKWCQEHQDKNGWVNITIKKSQKGMLYGELDQWKKNAEIDQSVAPVLDSVSDSVWTSVRNSVGDSVNDGIPF